ncbi:MAG: biotin--protein ligase [Burkholderiaceae bacterium]|nr:MAG: biotin--protein ligase [Burkholderiaceae bacterium]TAM00262.1 MAG: biotin--protein ligase [Pusillimonas sp.]
MTKHDEYADAAAHHGEYKIPEGKLVVVDLQIVQGRLHNVRLSGDFFLEPPEALDAMSAALNGLPYDAPQARLEQVVQAAAGDAMMYGITAAGVAIAVRRTVA